MNKSIFLLSVTVILIFCNGCISASNGFDMSSLPPVPQKYNFPVKFYVKSFTENSSNDYNKKVFSSTFTRKFRQKLCAYYPELFTQTPEQGLQVEFYITPGARKEVNWGQSVFGAVCSWLSLGIIPAQQNRMQMLKLEVRLENLTRCSEIKLLQKLRGNGGILGFCKTRLLLADLEHNWFDGIDVLEARPEHDKDIIQFFINELYRFPEQKVMEMYISQKTKENNLLE